MLRACLCVCVCVRARAPATRYVFRISNIKELSCNLFYILEIMYILRHVKPELFIRPPHKRHNYYALSMKVSSQCLLVWFQVLPILCYCPCMYHISKITVYASSSSSSAELFGQTGL